MNSRATRAGRLDTRSPLRAQTLSGWQPLQPILSPSDRQCHMLFVAENTHSATVCAMCRAQHGWVGCVHSHFCSACYAHSLLPCFVLQGPPPQDCIWHAANTHRLPGRLRSGLVTNPCSRAPPAVTSLVNAATNRHAGAQDGHSVPPTPYDTTSS